MATYDQVKSALSKLPHKEMILATCEIAREYAWRFMKDESSKKAIEAAEGYVNGRVTKDGLKVACSDAYEYASDSAAAYRCDPSAANAAAGAAAGAAAVAAEAADHNKSSVIHALFAVLSASIASDAAGFSKLRDRQLEIIAKYAKKNPSLTGEITATID
jgi:hypothetical protein